MNGSKDVVHTYAGIPLSHRKEQTFASFGTQMDLEVIIPSEIKGKYDLIPLIREI